MWAEVASLLCLYALGVPSVSQPCHSHSWQEYSWPPLQPLRKIPVVVAKSHLTAGLCVGFHATSLTLATGSSNLACVGLVLVRGSVSTLSWS